MLNLEKFDVILAPTEREFEKYGVLNPGIYQESNIVLLFYRAVQYGNLAPIGYAKAALLNIDNPKIELSRLPYPNFSPTKFWEIEGTVNNVVFPSGHP